MSYSAIFCIYCGAGVRIAESKRSSELYPFCNNHYFAIPMRLRKFLYQGESAWQAALEFLEDKYGKREPHAISKS